MHASWLYAATRHMFHSPVQLLCLLLQYAIISTLDMGCLLLNHRTTPAGLAPHGAILDGNGDVAATAAGCVTHTARRARQLLIHVASWTAVVAASALNWANRTRWNSQATHRRRYGWLDQLLGHHTNGLAARATLNLLRAPYLASIAGTRLARELTDLFTSIFISCMILLMYTGMAARSA